MAGVSVNKSPRPIPMQPRISKTAAKSAVAEDEEEKKIKPKRLRKAADEEENIPEDEK